MLEGKEERYMAQKPMEQGTQFPGRRRSVRDLHSVHYRDIPALIKGWDICGTSPGYIGDISGISPCKRLIKM
jgi:hypothetical protein